MNLSVMLTNKDSFFWLNAIVVYPLFRHGVSIHGVMRSKLQINNFGNILSFGTFH